MNLIRRIYSFLLVKYSLSFSTNDLLARVIIHDITEHSRSNTNVGQRRKTLLALSPKGFRGDLEALAESGRFRILMLPDFWQERLRHAFYGTEVTTNREYLNPPHNSVAFRQKERLQSFYVELLPKIYEKLQISAVLSYHIRVPADVDLGIASRKINVPYLVLYREGMFASSPGICKTMRTLFSRFGFWGTALFVHNESCRKLCIETGLSRPNQTFALGAMRMDSYLKQVQTSQTKQKRHNRVCLFPFTVKEVGKFDMRLFGFFKAVHIGLLEFAKENPDIEVIIKPKKKVLASWQANFDRAAREERIDVQSIKNFKVDCLVDAQTLILNSDVICGFNSTTILEAGLTDKPVIVPFFEESQSNPFFNMSNFKMHLTILT